MEYRDYYCGDMTIPQEKRAEFTERVLKIMDRSGLMGAESVELFGKKLFLLQPPKLDETNAVSTWLNYFEDEAYDAADYNADTAEFKCGYIGGHQFCDAVMAIWLLYEFYTETFGISHWDGVLMNAKGCIGWLNYLFDEKNTNERALDIWEVYKLIPQGMRESHNLTKMLDVCSSALGALKYLVCAEKLNKEKDREMYAVMLKLLAACYPFEELESCIGEIKAEEGSDGENLDNLKAILRTSAPERYSIDERELYVRFAKLSEQLPGEVSIKMVSDTFGLDFDQLMEEIGDQACAAARPIEKQDCLFPPLKPVHTREFLNCDDDDRVYWWTESGDVELSEEMEDWLLELSGEFREMQSSPELVGMDNQEAIRMFVEELHRANAVFGKLACFRDYFYESISNADHPSFQAATVLLSRLIDRLSVELPEADRSNWKSILNKRHSLPRRKLKRHLALLGNRELRYKVFDF